MISAALPVHNEAAFLPFSLRALRKAVFDELVVFLDDCSDDSGRLIDNYRKIARYPVRVFDGSAGSTYAAFRKTYALCEGDIIYSLAADMVVNPAVFSICWAGYDVVTFPHHDYGLTAGLAGKIHVNLMNCWKHNPVRTMKRYNGVYAFRRELLKYFPVQRIGYEELLFLYVLDLEDQVRFGHVDIWNLHLRPRLSGVTQYNQGVAKRELGHSLAAVLLHSLTHWKFGTLKGFLRARRV